MRCRLLALLILVVPTFVGCGSKNTGASANAALSGTVPSDPIARVVYEFFDAVRQGHTAEANQKLTPLALQRITEQEMNVTPPGSPTAHFQVGPVRTVESDHALVELSWGDVDTDGKSYNEPLMYCELRMCDGQWRICGMAQDQGPGLPPVVIDFEATESAAPQGQAQAAPGTGTGTVPNQTPAVQNREVATDPFQQPVTR